MQSKSFLKIKIYLVSLLVAMSYRITNATESGLIIDQPLVIGIKEVAPLAFFDSEQEKYRGYILDLIDLIFLKEKKINYELKPLKHDEITSKLISEKIKIYFSTNEKLDSESLSTHYFSQTEPYISFGIAILTKKKFNITSLKLIEKKNIGIIRGDKNENKIRQEFKNSFFYSFNSYKDAVENLENNEIIAIIGDEIELSKAKGQIGLEDGIYVDYENLTNHLFAYVKSNEVNLLKYFNNKIIELKEDKKFNQLFNKWFGSTSIYQINRN
jgi:polar amino acid transport system substrate-binding protein